MLQLKQLRRQIWIPSFPTVSMFVLQALRELLASYQLMFCTVVGLVWKKVGITFYLYMKLLVALISVMVHILK